MNNCYKVVMQMVKAAIHNEELNLTEDISEQEWEEVFDILARNGMLGITYAKMNSKADAVKLPDEYKNRWKMTAFQTGIRQASNQVALGAIMKGAKEAGVKLVIFKGYAVSILYPEPLMRLSCDSDIYVDIQNKEKAIEIIKANGFDYKEAGSKVNVPVFVNNKGNKIELHNRLWEDYEGKLTDILDSYHLTDESKYITIPLNGEEIYTLGINEHLIFQMYHIIKHFSLEGVGIKYFSDITLYVNRYINQIDIKKFWSRMKAIHYDTFCDVFFQIAVEYFGMNAKIIRKPVARESIENIIDDFMHVGKVDDSDENSWKIMHLLMPYYMQEREVPKGRMQRIRYLLFPLPNELTQHYQYAQKHKFLLPVAWIHRALNRLILGRKHQDSEQSAALRSKKVEHRLKLLEEVRLTK